MSRNGEFTVNIALIDEHDAVLGVVHVPVTDTTYTGVRDGGATRQVGSEAAVPIRTTAAAPTPLRIVGSRSHRDAVLDRYLPQLGPTSWSPSAARSSSAWSPKAARISIRASGRPANGTRLPPKQSWKPQAARDPDGRPHAALQHQSRNTEPALLVSGDPQAGLARRVVAAWLVNRVSGRPHCGEHERGDHHDAWS